LEISTFNGGTNGKANKELIWKPHTPAAILYVKEKHYQK
jgi:hypothetical protein